MKYICELCGTVYDEARGVPKRGVPAGTAFADLPKDYSCPGCGSGLEAFDPANTAKSAQPRKDTAEFWQSNKYAGNKLESER